MSEDVKMKTLEKIMKVTEEDVKKANDKLIEMDKVLENHDINVSEVINDKVAFEEYIKKALVFSPEQSKKIQDARKFIEDVREYAIKNYIESQKPKEKMRKLSYVAGLTALALSFALNYGFMKRQENIHFYDINRDLNKDGINEKVMRIGDYNEVMYSIKMGNNVLYVSKHLYNKFKPEANVDFKKHDDEYNVESSPRSVSRK